MATLTIDTLSRAAHARRWTRANLFASPGSAVLTIVTAVLGGLLLLSVGGFVFRSAEWEVIETNRRLLFLGRFPAGEEWRLWPALWGLVALGGLSSGLWLRIGRNGLAVLALVLVFLFLPMRPLGIFEGDNALLMLVGIALGAAGYAVALRAPAEGAYARRLRRVAIVGWAVLLPITWVLLQLGDGVKTSLWGGLFLNIMLATVGIAAGFPGGVVLALGRASSYPVIRWTCTTYIELVRAAPLIAWLFLARFVLPDFLPPVAGLNDLDIVIRAMIVLAGFTAAYVAEIVRGGLQSLPRGQHEAGQALGLNALQMTWLIILPQALRAVIPSLVGQFISLWKDTTLVFALGFTELLGAGQATLAQTEFIGRQREAFLFVAVIFWAVSFTMSRLSQRVERELGIGER
jgi:general L-amino acid transport system permease protein